MNTTDTQESDKRSAIVARATEVFLRYGYKRTTMGDLAKAAGISRPALYLHFPNKDEVFSAVAHAAADESFARIEVAVAGAGTVEEKLLAAMEIWAKEGYERLLQFPDARDLMDLNFPPIKEVYLRFEVLLAGILQTATDESPLDISAAKAARLLTFATRGYKEIAETPDELFNLVRLDIALLVRGLRG